MTRQQHPRAAPVQRARVLDQGARARRNAANDAAAIKSEAPVVLNRLATPLPSNATLEQIVNRVNDLQAALAAAQGFRR